MNIRKWVGRYLQMFYTRDDVSIFNSGQYWESRYSLGGHSGAGSYNRLAYFKADVLNRFVTEHAIDTVIEFGCGDGNQLQLATYPAYVGVDVSAEAIARCRALFSEDKSKRFLQLSEYRQDSAELALSLDVIYHLIEDSVFEAYMRSLFASATRYVIVYASNTDRQGLFQKPHVRHRKFTDYVACEMKDWCLQEKIKNIYPFNPLKASSTSFADFYIYAKR